MKKIILALAIGCYSACYAQVVDVSSITEVSLPSKIVAGHAIISPDGQSILLTDPAYKGLNILNLSTSAITQVTDAEGAGYNPLVLNNGNTIVYRQTTTGANKLRKSELKSKELSTGVVKTLISPTRDLEGVITMNDNIYAVNNKKLSSKKLSSKVKTENNIPVLSINNRQLMITINGKTTQLSPNGTDKSYIWPSVSPDGTKILYYVCGDAAYTANIDGSNITRVGILRAPKWYNDNIVIGMRNHSGEYDVESSSIVVKNINTLEEQTLTDSSIIAMYPTSTVNGEKVSFTTPDGKVYIINLKAK